MIRFRVQIKIDDDDDDVFTAFMPAGGSAKKSFIALPLPRHSFFFFRESQGKLLGGITSVK